MKQYLLIALATVFLLNIASLAVFGARDLWRGQHIVLPKTPHLTKEVEESLKEMRSDDSFAYEAFVGWKAWKQAGKYVNISADGVRRTIGQPATYKDEILMFGGSTTWGWGVGDAHTIPSQLQRLVPDRKVVNLGEISYNATQELNRFLIHLTEQPAVKGHVVFFDGINEILSSCSGVNGPYGHAMVEEIRTAIAIKRRNPVVGLLEDAFITQTQRLAAKVKGKLDPTPIADCANDDAYADKVARRLVTSWRAAAAIAKAYGLGFTAILQPTPYSDPALKHPRLVRKEWQQGVEAVFPKVRALAKNEPWFVDGTLWFDGRDPYVDECCHVNGADNGFLAGKILAALDRKQASHPQPIGE